MVMRCGRVLARRNIYERQVVACLRGGNAPDLRDVADAPAAFADLACLSRARGYDIFASGSPFVSEGEIALIARIAACQRQQGRALICADAIFLDAFLRCAAVLNEAGISLPFTTLADAAAVPARPVAGQSAHGALKRAHILSLARARDVISTDDFLSIGVSRQYLSLLCKGGYLQRIRHGWYRAANLPPAAAMLPS